MGLILDAKLWTWVKLVWADNKSAEEIQTRQYKAPEVILQYGH